MRVARLGVLVALASGCRAAAPPPPAAVAELWIGGDLHAGSRGDALDGLAPLLASGALIANLEGPVAAGRPSSTRAGSVVTLANDPAVLPALAKAGLRVAGIENNHARDPGTGTTAVELTRAGILSASTAPAMLTVNGLRIAVTAHDLGAGAPASLAADLRAARRDADVLVAMFHVTGPALNLPRPELREAAEIALREGASVVAAHGTHSLAPVERRGDVVIAWGLGNLAFECDCTDERRALLLHLRVGAGRVIAAEAVPIDAGLHGGSARPAADAAFTLDILEAIGSSPLHRESSFASF